MLEITGDHIAALNDEDLRTLIALLCEGELRDAGLPIAGVTAGGNQNAADGGLDVHVQLSAEARVTGFIPRTNTGFQVKATDMPPGAIADEVAPNGAPRPIIQELAAASGAYVIVSSRGSTSDSALRRRRTAMADALQAIGPTSLYLDFYDRTRIATWVRQHLAA